MDRIILASASPRRKQLLEWAEIPFDIIPSDADEMVPDRSTGFRNSCIPCKSESCHRSKENYTRKKSYWQLTLL